MGRRAGIGGKRPDHGRSINGRHNLEEGGPKGLDIDTTSKVLAATSEYQPLTFFNVATLLQHVGAARSLDEQEMLDISYELSLMKEAQTVRAALKEQALRHRRSWRATALLRRLNSSLQRYISATRVS